MSTAAFKTVREVSSEDSVHGAANLLQMQPNKKWKTESSGEKSAYVILELEEPQQIIGIDIGNEHSAFVEVLVSKSGCKNDDFKEILLASSFMTPIESKNSTNVNRVRCFNKEALVETTQQDKWKLVKVICIQPFNKNVQYGLCFIKVHVAAKQKKSLVPEKFLQKTTTPTQTQTLAMQPKPIAFGRFKLREFSSDSETESSAALFSRWKTSRQSNDATNPTTTAAASIREASKLNESRRISVNNNIIKQQHTTNAAGETIKNSDLRDEEPTAATSSSSSKVLDRNRKDLLFGYNDDDDKISSSDAKKRHRLSKQIELDQERLRQEKEKLRTPKDKQRRQSIKQNESPKTKTTAATSPSTSSSKKSLDAVSSHSKANRSSKRMSSPSAGTTSNVQPKKLKSNDVPPTLQYRPFNQLLRGVVLVISGIQNPDRADLRSKALALGARYKADWDHSCTHLICAFKNTPKYNHVKGKGKIVTRSWIEKCYALKKYLPWRRYAIDSSELAQPESDAEIVDESLKPSKTLHVANIEKTHPEKDSNLNNNTLALYDQEDGGRPDSQNDNGISEDSDTDDELQRVAKKNCATKMINNENSVAAANRGKKCDIFEMSTDEEDFLKEKLQKENLFFANAQFCICDDISAVDKIKLNQLIRKYGGRVISGDHGNATFLITESVAKSKLDKSVGAKFVRPLWIYECNDMEMRVSEERYLVTK